MEQAREIKQRRSSGRQPKERNEQARETTRGTVTGHCQQFYSRRVKRAGKRDYSSGWVAGRRVGGGGGWGWGGTGCIVTGHCQQLKDWKTAQEQTEQASKRLKIAAQVGTHAVAALT